jgi:hypothetical protein
VLLRREGWHVSFRPGRPVENGFIESFNGRLRDERGVVCFAGRREREAGEVPRTLTTKVRTAPCAITFRQAPSFLLPGAPSSAARLASHDQLFLPIQPVDALGIHVGSCQFFVHNYTPWAIAQASNARPENSLPFIHGDTARCGIKARKVFGEVLRRRLMANSTGPGRVPLTDPIGLLRPARQLPTRTRPYSFLRQSPAKSAGLCLNPPPAASASPFSSRNCRNSRNSLPHRNIAAATGSTLPRWSPPCDKPLSPVLRLPPAATRPRSAPRCDLVLPLVSSVPVLGFWVRCIRLVLARGRYFF